MPGRTAAQARENFLDPLRRAISCISNAQLYAYGGDVETLMLSEDPLRLRSELCGDVQLHLGQHYRLVKDASDEWHVSTVAYLYRLDDDEGRELISWHWHPGRGTNHAHMHVSARPFGRRTHLPTGRVSIESLLRLLLTDLDVPPTRDHADDFAQVLDQAERNFIVYRSWHA